MAKGVKIGLEIHGYLQTKEKLFCRCRAIRHAAKKQIKPNTLICPVCTGQPGAKPMLPNSEAIKKIIQIGLMLNCKINTKQLVWNRKHYDWPDLPKGYQETVSGAYSIPIAQSGNFSKIRISDCHLEEDPASWNPETGCIDYNRSGLPLVEIVTEPDFKEADEVELWLKELLLVLSYIKAVDKNAGLKADVNVSVKGGQRVEIKNLNSIQNIKAAIQYEIERQEKEKAVRETRRYDEVKGKTIPMRIKELAEDYRFIPDPDLPIIKLTDKEIKEIKSQLPETPKEKLDRLLKKHKIKKQDAEVLYKNIEIVEFFEQVTKKVNPRFALPWITIELLRVLNYNKKTLDDVDIKPEHFIELLQAVKSNKLTELKAKRIINDFIPKSFSIKTRLKKEAKISANETEKIIKKVLEKNTAAVRDYKAGKKESLNYLMGEIMKASKRRVDYKTALESLKKLLK
jgi:aspartyl-tRNA(Asn)/glutamyl-tRNA(Gln) amidotransferase subunit B